MRYECITDMNDVKKNRRLVYGSEIFPVLHGVYTIRAIEYFGSHKGYLLNEIVNEPRAYNGGRRELIFGAEHFRPITDISALTQLTKVRELEDA